MLAQTDLESCIQECTRCHAVCVKTVQYCLKKGGRHAAAASCPLDAGLR